MSHVWCVDWAQGAGDGNHHVPDEEAGPLGKHPRWMDDFQVSQDRSSLGTVPISPKCDLLSQQALLWAATQLLW